MPYAEKKNKAENLDLESRVAEALQKESSKQTQEVPSRGYNQQWNFIEAYKNQVGFLQRLLP